MAHMDYKNMISDLERFVAEAKSGGSRYVDIPWRGAGITGSNQFLFFLKPELTKSMDKFHSLAEFVFSKLDEFHLFIENAFIISGEYLAEHRVMSAHYGVIDAAAHSPETSMTPSMWKTFEESFMKKPEGARVVGSIPYLEEHPELDPAALSAAWLKREYTRVGSGTYCEYIDEEDLYLVNGFYPRLLNHFTRPENCIVCFILRGSTPWSSVRGEFAGATAPERAAPGSVRNGFLTRKDEFGLPEVSANLNGVHLSAGPLEGVVEILRFSSGNMKLSDLVFGKMLEENFSKAEIDLMLSNGPVSTKGGETTYFDLTEELDSAEAINAMRARVT
jgi:hypothetical protein